jgi:hypothetical protein
MEPNMTALAGASSNCKRQTCPLVRQGVQHRQTPNSLRVTKIILSPDGCLAPIWTPRLTVGRNVTLALKYTGRSQRGRPSSTNMQLSGSKKMVLSARWDLTPSHTGRMTVGRYISFTFKCTGRVLQQSDCNRNLVLSPKCALATRLAGRLTVGRTMNFFEASLNEIQFELIIPTC